LWNCGGSTGTGEGVGRSPGFRQRTKNKEQRQKTKEQRVGGVASLLRRICKAVGSSADRREHKYLGGRFLVFFYSLIFSHKFLVIVVKPCRSHIVIRKIYAMKIYSIVREKY